MANNNSQAQSKKFFVDVRTGKGSKAMSELVNRLASYNINVVAHIQEAEEILKMDYEGRKAAETNGALTFVAPGQPRYNVPSLGILARVAVERVVGARQIAGKFVKMTDQETGERKPYLVWFGLDEQGFRDRNIPGGIEQPDEKGIYRPSGLKVPYNASEKKYPLNLWVMERPATGEQSILAVSWVESLKKSIVEEFPVKKISVEGEWGAVNSVVVSGHSRSSGLRSAFTRHNQRALVTGKPGLCLALPDETVALLRDDVELNHMIEKVANRANAYDPDLFKEVADYIASREISLFDGNKVGRYSIASYPEALLSLEHQGVWLVNPPAWVLGYLGNQLAANERAHENGTTAYEELRALMVEQGLWEEQEPVAEPVE